jgi:hypothetical protein
MSLKKALGSFAPFAGVIPQALMNQSSSGSMGIIPMLLDSEGKKKKGVDATDVVKSSDASEAMKRGGSVKAKKYAKGGSVSSRADGCCSKGKTKGKMV